MQALFLWLRPFIMTRPTQHMSESEQNAILVLSARGLTDVSIAKEIGRPVQSVRRCRIRLKDLDELARAKLQHGTVEAAEKWVESLGPAAKRGDHKPSRDLLQATGIVKTDASQALPTIQVNVSSATYMPPSPTVEAMAKAAKEQGVEYPVILDAEWTEKSKQAALKS